MMLWQKVSAYIFQQAWKGKNKTHSLSMYDLCVGDNMIDFANYLDAQLI